MTHRSASGRLLDQEIHGPPDLFLRVTDVRLQSHQNEMFADVTICSSRFVTHYSTSTILKLPHSTTAER
jgi:uncharacterized membrane protein YagU involved in acid resistance